MKENNNENHEFKRITQYDIAAALGVSHTTVSMSLRNNPRISEATQKRVQEKAEEMGYHPDPMLSALSSYRASKQTKTMQSTLAWINPFRDPAQLRQSKEFELYWQGATAAAKHMGYTLEEFDTAELPLPRMNSIFKARNIQGILLATLCGPRYEDPSIDWLAFPWKDYAIVRLGRNHNVPKAHYITSAQTSVGILAFQTMRERGYQRIGFVGIHSRQRIFSAGVSFAQEEIPVEDIIPRLPINEADSIDTQKNALKKWIQTHQPDAILTDRPNLLELLNHLDYRVPDDLAVATTSIHDTPINAGIDQNPREIGHAAVRTLISLINEHTHGIPAVRNEIKIEGKWVDGSMLPRRQASCEE